MLNLIAILSAKYLIFLSPILIFFYLIKQNKNLQKKMLLFLIINLPIIFIISQIISHFYYNPRPFVIDHFTPLVAHAANNGFPSDHALLAFALAFTFFIFNRKISMILAIIGIIIGAARVYAGIHSPIDIAGSFIISLSVSFLVYRIFHKKLV